MRVLGVITARGGSKGIPRKNLVDLCGKPLLQYTTECALDSDLDRVILSTDDEAIAQAGARLGVEVPFMRPPELARDDTPSIPVVQHAMQWAEEDEGRRYDALFLLQPTNPLREPTDINTAINMLATSQVDSVISFVPVGEHHPARMKCLSPAGHVIDPPFAEVYEGQRRQELPPFYLREGSVYLTRRDTLMRKNSLQGDTCQALLFPIDRACAIDRPFDLFLAEQMLKYRQRNSREGISG